MILGIILIISGIMIALYPPLLPFRLCHNSQTLRTQSELVDFFMKL